MSYSHGKVLKGLPLPKGLDFSKVQLVLVRGDGLNKCGHILLHVPGGFGHYFHFDGPKLYEYPRYLEGDSEYRAYLAGSNKIELLRKSLTIPHPDAAEARLNELMHNEWLTFIGSHNCASFASEVIHAGGNFWTLPRHCPVLDVGAQFVWDAIFGPIRELLGTEEAYQKSLLR